MSGTYRISPLVLAGCHTRAAGPIATTWRAAAEALSYLETPRAIGAGKWGSYHVRAPQVYVNLLLSELSGHMNNNLSAVRSVLDNLRMLAESAAAVAEVSRGAIIGISNPKCSVHWVTRGLGAEGYFIRLMQIPDFSPEAVKSCLRDQHFISEDSFERVMEYSGVLHAQLHQSLDAEYPDGACFLNMLLSRRTTFTPTAWPTKADVVEMFTGSVYNKLALCLWISDNRWHVLKPNVQLDPEWRVAPFYSLTDDQLVGGYEYPADFYSALIPVSYREDVYYSALANTCRAWPILKETGRRPYEPSRVPLAPATTRIYVLPRKLIVVPVVIEFTGETDQHCMFQVPEGTMSMQVMTDALASINGKPLDPGAGVCLVPLEGCFSFRCDLRPGVKETTVFVCGPEGVAGVTERRYNVVVEHGTLRSKI